MWKPSLAHSQMIADSVYTIVVVVIVIMIIRS